MTPTPDAPLTAEQIAAIAERSDATRFVLDANYEREPPWWYRCHETQLDGAALLASHEALRDQLAAAEGRERALRQTAQGWVAMIQDQAQLCEMRAHGQYQERVAKLLSTIEQAFDALAAPTDGAARGGEGE